MAEVWTMEYLQEEFHRLYEMMGSRAFWELPTETRDKAIQGFTLSAVQVEGEEYDDQVTRLMDLIMTEYSRRTANIEVYKAFNGGKLWETELHTEA